MEYNLDRFIEAQTSIYSQALSEITRGRKTLHWMWFIFPQLAGLGRSETAQRYGIGSLNEARAYLAHPVLGNRYLECVEALQDLPLSDPKAVLGSIDATKRSVRSTPKICRTRCALRTPDAYVVGLELRIFN